MEHTGGQLPVAPGAGRPAASGTADSPTVFFELAAGWSNREIAASLHLSEGTVRVHVGRILTKLGLRDRVQAVVMAYESGLITPGS
jgi:DNA-binding NarL/FixJ family response regulator